MEIENKIFILTIKKCCFEFLLFPGDRENDGILTSVMLGMSIDNDMFLVYFFGNRFQLPKWAFWVSSFLAVALKLKGYV